MNLVNHLAMQEISRGIANERGCDLDKDNQGTALELKESDNIYYDTYDLVQIL